jgi:hypothetical protein
MPKQIKKWKKLTKGEQNTFYYTFLGYSKMDSAYNLPKEYQKGCEIRKKKEEKENEKYTNDY